MHDWQLYAFSLHARQGYTFLNAVKAEFQQAEKPETGRFMLIFWRFYALQDKRCLGSHDPTIRQDCNCFKKNVIISNFAFRS
jgi:hypothetical protein